MKPPLQVSRRRGCTKRVTVSLAALLLLLLPSFSQEAWAGVKVKGQSSYKPYEPIILTAQGINPKATYQFIWRVSAGAKYRVSQGTLYVWAPPGSYTADVTAIDFDAKTAEQDAIDFTVEGAVPPIPPGPTPPGPIPPGPNPPGPAPIPAAGLRVLIVYDDNTLNALPAGQQNVLFSQAVREALRTKCLTDASNPNGAWRIWKSTQDPSGDADKSFPTAFARPRTSLPWVVISNGTTGYEGPLPASPTDFLTLLSKFAAPSARKKAA